MDWIIVILVKSDCNLYYNELKHNLAQLLSLLHVLTTCTRLDLPDNHCCRSLIGKTHQPRERGVSLKIKYAADSPKSVIGWTSWLYVSGSPVILISADIRSSCFQFIVAAGASPGMVSELAHLLQMPAKMAESLLSKNPTLQSVTVMQVCASPSVL